MRTSLLFSWYPVLLIEFSSLPSWSFLQPLKHNIRINDTVATSCKQPAIQFPLLNSVWPRINWVIARLAGSLERYSPRNGWWWWVFNHIELSLLDMLGITKNIEQSTFKAFAVNHFELKLGHNATTTLMENRWVYHFDILREVAENGSLNILLATCFQYVIESWCISKSCIGHHMAPVFKNLSSCTSYWKALDLWFPNRANDYQKKPNVSPVYIPSEPATLLRNFNFNITVYIFGVP